MLKNFVIVDTDILKPDTGALSIERPQHTSSSKGSSGSERAGSSGDATPDDLNKYPYTEPVSEGEEDEERDLAPGALFPLVGIIENNKLIITM